MTRWLVIAASLAALTAAGAASAAVSGTGTITGSGTSYTLVVKNTGTDTIQCMRWFAPSGTTVPTASGLGTTAPFEGGFGAGGLSIKPGDSASFRFTTSKPLTYTSNGQLHLSADCQSDVSATVLGPSEKPGPCECKNIGTRTSAVSDFTANDAGITAFSFHIDWSMNCGGAVGKCAGEIDVLAPGGTDIRITSKTKINCAGKCGSETITTSKGSFRVRGTSVNSLDQDKRAGKSFEFQFNKFCTRNGKRLAAGHGFMTIVYGPTGLFDLRRSDLNGDNKPDKK